MSRSETAGGLGAVVIVGAAVGFQVLGAVLLKSLVDLRAEETPLLLAAGMAVVLALNGVRFGVWSLAHARFPIARTVPFGALFFPAMLPVAVAFGDPVGPAEILGALLIAAGAAALSAGSER